MAARQSAWEFLSNRATDMLSTCNGSALVNHSLDVSKTFLREAGCPAFPSFIRYLTSYAGLSLAFSQETVRSNLRFLSIGNGAECVQNKQNEWRLLFADS